MPVLPSVPDVAPDVDLSKYAGTYARLNMEITLTVDGDALTGTTKLSGPLAEMLPDEESKPMTIVPVDSSLFLATSDESPTPMPFVFFDFDGDAPKRFHMGARAMTRVAS